MLSGNFCSNFFNCSLLSTRTPVDSTAPSTRLLVHDVLERLINGSCPISPTCCGDNPQPTEGPHGGVEWAASQLLKVTVGQGDWLTAGTRARRGLVKSSLLRCQNHKSSEVPRVTGSPRPRAREPRRVSVPWPDASTPGPSSGSPSHTPSPHRAQETTALPEG